MRVSKQMREALASGAVLGAGVGTASTLIQSGVRYGFNMYYNQHKLNGEKMPDYSEDANVGLPSYQRSLLNGAAVGAATFGATATGLYAYHALAGNVRY